MGLLSRVLQIVGQHRAIPLPEPNPAKKPCQVCGVPGTKPPRLMSTHPTPTGWGQGHDQAGPPALWPWPQFLCGLFVSEPGQPVQRESQRSIQGDIKKVERLLICQHGSQGGSRLSVRGEGSHNKGLLFLLGAVLADRFLK